MTTLLLQSIMIVATKKGDEKMSPLQKGSKLTDNPKNTMLRVRIDKETVNKLNFISEHLRLSKSEIVRNGIDEQYNKLKK